MASAGSDVKIIILDDDTRKTFQNNVFLLFAPTGASFSPTKLSIPFFIISGLDRKISVRATRDELIERGILLPDVATVAPRLPPISSLSNRESSQSRLSFPGKTMIPMLIFFKEFSVTNFAVYYTAKRFMF